MAQNLLVEKGAMKGGVARSLKENINILMYSISRVVVPSTVTSGKPKAEDEIYSVNI